jgi:hypothetical protein
MASDKSTITFLWRNEMSKKALFGSLCVVAAVLVTVSVLWAQGDRTQTPARDVTLVGKIVDLHCCMTGKFPSTDQVKCTRECIRAGVPAALETEEGLIVLGQGPKGPARTIDDLAFQFAEVKGKLYERDGLRYLDLTSAKAAPAPQPKVPAEPDFDEAEEAEEYDQEPEDSGSDG